MSPKHDGQQDCAAVRMELTQVICGDTAAPSETLDAHLAQCATCREEFESSRELARTLSAALSPEPLSEELLARVRSAWETPQAAERVPIRTIGGGWWAAAAAVLLAVVLSPWTLTTTSAPSTSVDLTKNEAAAVMQAYAVLELDSYLEYSMEALSQRVNELERVVERDEQEMLPWGPDDDWDIPPGEPDTSDVLGNREPRTC